MMMKMDKGDDVESRNITVRKSCLYLVFRLSQYTNGECMSVQSSESIKMGATPIEIIAQVLRPGTA